MYVKQFWRDFEETGSVEAYLNLKQYEKLNNEHTESVETQNTKMIDEDGLDGMK